MSVLRALLLVIVALVLAVGCGGGGGDDGDEATIEQLRIDYTAGSRACTARRSRR